MTLSFRPLESEEVPPKNEGKRDMNRIEISANNEVMTLINLFDVEPNNQEELVTNLKSRSRDSLE
jgi:hypothetical protein